MVEILAHRGSWRSPEEANSNLAFHRCFSNGFGCELDVRDFAGTLVVSHDPPAEKGLEFDTVLETYRETRAKQTIAINVKADGLQGLLSDVLTDFDLESYFLFDMSVPDTRQCLKAGFPIFTRQSEFEAKPVFYEDATGVWIDCFQSDWINADVMNPHLDAGKKVALVSPELHGRDPAPAWESWREICIAVNDDNVMLCTDHPDQANEYFNV